MTSSRAKLPLLAVLIAMLTLAAGATAAQADTLDQQQTDASGGVAVIGGPSAGAVSQAQTFTAGLYGWIDRVQLYLSPSGSATGPRRSELVLRALRPMTHGSYTLTLWRHHGNRWLTTSRQITVA